MITCSVMLNLIFSQVYNGYYVLISAAFGMALPVSHLQSYVLPWFKWASRKKIYAIAMMWTLNARRKIRIEGSMGYMTSSADRGHAAGRNAPVSCTTT